MNHATLACLAALGLIGSTALAPAQQAAPATPQPAPTRTQPPPAGAAQPAAAKPAETGATAAAPTVGRTSSGSTRAERRRRSYAACNRASHQRGLRGGKRRRFLIRCRLGYERTRQPSSVTAPANAQPVVPPPGRRP